MNILGKKEKNIETKGTKISTIEDEIYLTDEQYLDLLNRMEQKLAFMTETPNVYDDDTPGEKDTWSNCGLCCRDFITKSNSLRPEDFPRDRSLRYQQEHQPCPMDNRVRFTDQAPVLGFNCGCYYNCCLRRSIRGDKEKLLLFVRETRREFLKGTFKAMFNNEIK